MMEFFRKLFGRPQPPPSIDTEDTISLEYTDENMQSARYSPPIRKTPRR